MEKPASKSRLIVGATDGSQLASVALREGLELVDLVDVDVQLATVIPTLDAAFVTPADAMAPVSGGAEFLHYESILRDRGQKLLSEAASALPVAAGEKVVLAGSPGPALRDYADDEGASLIVVGRQGMGAVDRLLLGSVSDFLSRKAHCPVLVVPAKADKSNTGPVVIATDGSAHAQRAANRVVPLLPEETPIAVATVTSEAPGHPTDALQMLRERTTEGLGVEIDDALASRLAREDAQIAVLHGEPATALLEYADQIGARALVIGTRGHGGLSRAVLGSVAHSVVTNSTRPVFIVGPRA